MAAKIYQDFVVEPFFDKIQKVKWDTFENSSHSAFIEEADRYMKLASDFLLMYGKHFSNSNLNCGMMASNY